MRMLAPLTGLTNLNLGECSEITDEGVRALIPLTGLTDLDLEGCDEVTDEGVRALWASRTALVDLSIQRFTTSPCLCKA
jgi:hypothetical protein